MITATEPNNKYESGFPKLLNRSTLDIPVNTRLRTARERKRLTLSRATKELNKRGIECAMSTLQSYEASHESLNRRLPSIKMLVSLAYLYDCSIDYLVGISDEINIYNTDLHEQITKNNSVLEWKGQVIEENQMNMLVHKANLIMSI